MIFSFFAFWAVIVGAILIWQAMSGREKWKVFKTLMFGAVTSVLAVAVITFIVILF
jgi:hypothetical protein